MFSRFGAVLGILVILACSTHAQMSYRMGPAERSAIARLLQSQEVIGRIEQTIDKQISDLKTKYPSLPASTFKVLQDSSRSTVIVEHLSEAWAGKFTVAELDQIRVFLASSAGKKFMELNPAITADMMATGSLLGIHIYEMLTRLHPDAFQMDANMKNFKAKMLQARDKARQGKTK
jgi:hypothetical protein